MPRRRPVDSPSQIVAIGHQGGQAGFLFGRFFLGAQIDAAQLLAFVLQALDTLFGLLERRQFFAVLDLGAFRQLGRRAFQFVMDAGLEFLDPLRGAFRQCLSAGAFLARRRQRRVESLGQLVGFGQHAFGFLAGIRSLVARRLCRGDGVQKSAALFGNLLRQLFRAGQLHRQFFLTAGQFRDMALCVSLARIPAGLFLADRGQAAGAGLAFATQAFQGARASPAWVRASAVLPRTSATLLLSATPSPSSSRPVAACWRDSCAASTDWVRRRISDSSDASCEARSAAARAARVA